MKVWTSVLIALGIGIPLVAMARSGDSAHEKRRRVIRGYFTVSGDCHITFNGDANAFWQRFDPYLEDMIQLGRSSLGLTTPSELASYTMMALFPECDQTKEQTPSFQAVYAALEFRLDALMG